MKFLCISMLIIGVYCQSIMAAVPKRLHSVKTIKKVLLIGIDGLQYEKIKALHTPNFDAFKIVKAYAGGIVGTPSQQTTGSGPGWMTILTGVWSDKHGVISNDTANKSKVRSVFQYLKEHDKKLQTTSIATWSTIHDFLDKQVSYVDKRFDGGTDKQATEKVITELKTGNADLMFVHFSDPDNIGHVHGYGDKYDHSVEVMDDYLGKIMNAVNNRAKENNEEWLVIVTTDHGRRGDGHNHGSQTVEEKTVFIGMNVLGNDEFNTVLSQVQNKDFGGIYGYPPQTSILPTILTYFNIDIDRKWQLSSPSLIGKEGPRKVMINAERKELYWYSADPGYAKIYKDKKLVATVPARQGSYPINARLGTKPHNYTIIINGQSGSVIQDNLRITAATNWNDNKKISILFNDKSYISYNKGNGKPEKRYAIAVFPCFENYIEKMQAVSNRDDSHMLMFLNDGTYILYNLKMKMIEEGYPKEITNASWPGLEAYGKDIVGAVKMNETQIYFFSRYGTHVVFNIKENKLESSFALPINEKSLPGLRPYASRISAAMDYSSKYFYIFLKDNTYLKYDKLKNKVMSKYPISISNTTWQGLIH